jgi:hypothetical protein
MLNLCFFSPPALGQITIGADSGTLNAINQLPDQIRKALTQALVDALPLIDKSVTGYLQQVNKLLSENIANGATAIQCAEIGSVKIIQTELGTSLANILFTGRRAGLNERTIGNYTQNLSDSISDMRKNVTVDTEATDVLVAYSDLLIRAAIVKCAANINPALLQYEPDAQIRRISIPSLEWNILIGNRDRPYCKKVHECLVQRRADIKKFLDAANPADKTTSKAEELIATVPATPDLPSSLMPFSHPNIQILDYEQIFLSLRDIERAVEAAKVTREGRAKQRWDEAIKGRDTAVTYVNNNQDNLNHPTDLEVDSNITIQRVPEMVRLSNVAIGLATDAVKEDSRYKANSDELIKSMNDNIKHAENMKAAASANLASIERAKFDAMHSRRMGRFEVR